MKLKLVAPARASLKVSSPRLKLKTVPRYPAQIVGGGHILVTSENGVVKIQDDGTMLTAAGGPNNSGQMAVFVGENQVEGVGIQASSFLTSAIEFVLDGAGLPLLTGYKGVVELPFSCNIVRSRLSAGSVGNMVMDVFKTTMANPTGGASICAAARPTLSAAQFAEDTKLTGWTKQLAAGDALAFYIITGGIQQATLSLLVTRF